MVSLAVTSVEADECALGSIESTKDWERGYSPGPTEIRGKSREQTRGRTNKHHQHALQAT